MLNFPINVFEDVNPDEFSKHNKKHVTEDYVTENLKLVGWRVYRPFNDTGIDLIATKLVCPKGHTLWNNTDTSKVCNKCGDKKIEIKRFIQVKTREVKGSEGSKELSFGYTLKSKDFRTDPRHVFLLYSDYTNDFIIIPMYEYMKIFSSITAMGKSHFSTPSFRQGNNKLNSLKKNLNDNKWYWSYRGGKKSFDNFVNDTGMELISSPDYENNFNDYVNKIQELKFQLYYNYSRGTSQVSEDKELKINKHFNNFTRLDPNSIKNLRATTKKMLQEDLSIDLIDSIEDGYFVKFKGVSLRNE